MAKLALVQDQPQGSSSARILEKALSYANIDKSKVLIEGQGRWDLRGCNVIVALGEQSLIRLTGRTGITKQRGSILSSPTYSSVKIVPSLTPDFIRMGNFQHFWSLVGDLSRAERQSHFPGIRKPQWTSITSPDLGAVKRFLATIGEDDLWSLDIETRSQHLACLSVASGDRAMCIPIQNPSGPAYLPGHEATIWKELQRVMDRNPRLVGQNLTFDLEYLFDYGLEPSGIWMDTMLSHAILYPEFPKGLDFLCALYTEMPYYKSEGKVSNPKITTQDLWTYNNKDTITTLWCAIEIEKQLRARGLWPVHEFVTSELGLALEMQRNRLVVDPGKRAELSQMVNEAQADLDAKWGNPELVTLKKLAHETSYTKPNVNSPKQVAEFLYSQKGLGLLAKTRQGSVVADEAALSELKARHPEHPEIGWILEERHLRKLKSSYLDIELEQDSTIGGSWCVHGTETGRWSSGKSPRGRGMNLQTVPRAVRWMCVPPTREEQHA